MRVMYISYILIIFDGDRGVEGERVSRASGCRGRAGVEGEGAVGPGWGRQGPGWGFLACSRP
jgi:hypothetical protein